MEKQKIVQKACPVVLRQRAGITDILVFRHPKAGLQLVKGTVEDNESFADACSRELMEESGVPGVSRQWLGEWCSETEHHQWGFYLMEVEDNLPDKWDFFTLDDGGLNFSFFWQPLDDVLTDEWHPLFVSVIDHLRIILPPR